MSTSTNFSRVKDLEATAVRARNDTVGYVKEIKALLFAHNERITKLENLGIYIDNDGDICQS